MKELIRNAKEHIEHWKKSRRFWGKIAWVFGFAHYIACLSSMLMVEIKRQLNGIPTRNLTTSYGNLTADFENITAENGNFSSSVNATDDYERSYNFLWSSAGLPSMIVMLEFVNFFGEYFPGGFGIVVDKNFVAFGPNPSKSAQRYLILNILAHIVHILYTVFFNINSFLSTFDLVWLILLNIFGIACSIPLRYACTQIHILFWEEELEYQRTELEAGRELSSSTGDTRRWNWYFKGTFVLQLFYILTLGLVLRLLWVNIVVYEKMIERISPGEILWSLPLVSLGLFYREQFTDWKNIESLAECIIYKKIFVAHGPNPSLLARVLLAKNLLFCGFHFLVVLCTLNFKCMNDSQTSLLLFVDISLIFLNIVVRHSFSLFYNFTSLEEKMKVIEEVKNRKKKKVEKEAAIAVKNAKKEMIFVRKQ